MQDMSGGYALDSSDLDAIVRLLSVARTELSDDVESLSASPDAGRSSDEVAKAFSALSAAAGGLAQRIGDISTTLADNVARYRDTDARVGEAFLHGGERR